jgi:hypothetical protein
MIMLVLEPYVHMSASTAVGAITHYHIKPEHQKPAAQQTEPTISMHSVCTYAAAAAAAAPPAAEARVPAG